MAKVKSHMPIMVNVAVYAIRFATAPELPRELSFGVGVGDPREDQEKMAFVIWLFHKLGGGKIKVSYAYNDQCSSICDAICDWTGVAPGVVPLGSE